MTDNQPKSKILANASHASAHTNSWSASKQAFAKRVTLSSGATNKSPGSTRETNKEDKR